MRSLSLAAALIAALAIAAPASAASNPKITSCPTFRVLHNDPQAGYDAGTYDMQVWGSVTCARAVSIFRNYLSDPSSLPSGWSDSQVQASITRGTRTGFSLTLVNKRTTPNGPKQTVTNCPSFRVLGPDPDAGFQKGTYILQVFGNVTCPRASTVFKNYLDDPPTLPRGWRRVKLPPSFFNGSGTKNGFSVFRN